MDASLLRQAAGVEAEAPVEGLGAGSDCTAWLVGGRVVVKAPSHEGAALALSREAAVLQVVRQHVRLRVPDMVFLPGPPPLSRHRLIAGKQVSATVYDDLDDAVRNRLALDLAQFHLDCHSIPVAPLLAAGAKPVPKWPAPSPDMLRHVPQDILPLAEGLLVEWDALPAEPGGTVWAHFDAHGWNMAFDTDRKVLNGLYDFGDSGFGPLHRDLIYSALVSPDLTQRLGRTYAALSGRPIEMQRLRVLSGAHRLWELSGAAAKDRPFQIAALRRWASFDWPRDIGKT